MTSKAPVFIPQLAPIGWYTHSPHKPGPCGQAPPTWELVPHFWQSSRHYIHPSETRTAPFGQFPPLTRESPWKTGLVTWPGYRSGQPFLGVNTKVGLRRFEDLNKTRRQAVWVILGVWPSLHKFTQNWIPALQLNFLSPLASPPPDTPTPHHWPISPIRLSIAFACLF